MTVSSGMRVLVVGSGGREHALVWTLNRSPHVSEIFAAPGNAGTSQVAHNVDIAADDINSLVRFAGKQSVDLVVVGPEVPLALGLVDALLAADIRAFGPTQQAAQLESSKVFSKAFMRDQGIPTADYQEFSDYDAAAGYVGGLSNPVVVKVDGLAAGKGAIVCDSAQEARAALKKILVDEAFGEAGSNVIVEERLTGPEVSMLAFSDGQIIATMPAARDHKRVYDGDEGPNTGGMGAFAPVPDVSLEVVNEIEQTVLKPAIAGMAARGTPYVGVLYAGMMLTSDGPKTLEFNCRFGDPEAQVILPLLQTDLIDVLLACVEGTLDQIDMQWKQAACATVVAASGGYPGSYRKGLPVTVPDDDSVMIFHAGTSCGERGQLVTSGGRVLAVSALGEDLDTALKRTYSGIERVHFEGMHYRTDIGQVT